MLLGATRRGRLNCGFYEGSGWAGTVCLQPDMIPAAPIPMQQPPAPRWQMLWREAVRDPRELLTLLGLDALAEGLSEAAARQFPLRVPRGFVARMRPHDPHDPLLRQVLPVLDEERVVPGFGLDAVGDTAAAGWRDAVALIAADPSLHEVILSGGDPLSLADHKLAELTDALRAIPHIRRLRLHTRLPVVLPERVDAGLLAWLGGLPWPVVVVLHANHANEFDPAVDAALARLRATGASLLNQAVLLRGVNDDAEALAALCERGFAAGVLPYYLHQLDRVAGAAHFEVDDARALALHAALGARLPGYLVPRLVREIPGQPGKTPLTGL